MNPSSTNARCRAERALYASARSALRDPTVEQPVTTVVANKTKGMKLLMFSRAANFIEPKTLLSTNALCGGASCYRHHRRGSIPTAIELSEFRQDRSADFSPLPAVLGAAERGGLKSALLNSMPGILGPLPARAAWREGVANPVSWWRYQDAPVDHRVRSRIVTRAVAAKVTGRKCFSRQNPPPFGACDS